MLCISVSTYCTVFFAPYRRFAYILPKCFAYISPEHFLLFIEKRRVSTNTFFVFIIAFPSALLYRIFCTVQAFCVHFAQMFCVHFARTFFIVYRKKACFNKHAFVFCCCISVSTCTVFFAPYRRFAYILSQFTLFSRGKSVSVYDTLYLLFLPSAQTLTLFCSQVEIRPN